VLILVDPIDPDSLRGTRLQGTLLRARRSLRNLAVYEGAMFRLTRASGRHCPRCGCKGEEVRHTKHSRVYECPKCGLRVGPRQGSAVQPRLQVLRRDGEGGVRRLHGDGCGGPRSIEGVARGAQTRACLLAPFGWGRRIASSIQCLQPLPRAGPRRV